MLDDTYIKQLKCYWEWRKIILFASYDDNIEVSYTFELLLKWRYNNIGLWIRIILWWGHLCLSLSIYTYLFNFISFRMDDLYIYAVLIIFFIWRIPFYLLRIMKRIKTGALIFICSILMLDCFCEIGPSSEKKVFLVLWDVFNKIVN